MYQYLILELVARKFAACTFNSATSIEISGVNVINSADNFKTLTKRRERASNKKDTCVYRGMPSLQRVCHRSSERSSKSLDRPSRRGLQYAVHLLQHEGTIRKGSLRDGFKNGDPDYF